MIRRTLWIFPLLCTAVMPAQKLNFSAPKTYSAAPGARAIAAADLNQDGILDLVVANSNSTTTPGSISILLGRGNGTFHRTLDYPMGVEPSAVAVADFDGDGLPDLAVANYFSSSISILKGNGDGTFLPEADYSLGGALPNCIAVGDFNHDGFLDLAVADYYGADGPGTVHILLGNGDTTFQSPVTYSFGSGVNIFAVAVADLNGDGNLDLVATDNNYVTGQIWVLLGNGDAGGTFQTPIAYTVPPGPTGVVVGDFNHDGKPDLALGEFSGIAILLGNGDGTFQAPASYGSGTAWSLAVADFNRDGHPDLAVSYSHGNGSVSVFLGRDDGTFRAPESFPSGNDKQYSIAVGLFNRDKRPDIAVTNTRGRTVSILLNSSAE